MMRIAEMLRGTAARIPEKEAVVCGDERVTWAELDRSVNRLANALLKNGVSPGSRVAVMMGNEIDTVRLYYAIARIGCTSVPIMPRSVAREIIHIVNDVSASVIIAGPEASAAVSDALTGIDNIDLVIGTGQGHGLGLDMHTMMALHNDTDPEISEYSNWPYAIQFTSGTTGAPKGCMLPHSNKVLSRMSMLTHVAMSDQDRALLFMPLTASLGSDMLHTHVMAGATTVLMQKFDPENYLRLIGAERITATYALESTFDMLVNHPNVESTDWSHLRYFFATSATRDLRSGVKILQSVDSFHAKFWSAYGCTEGGGWLTFLSPEDIEASVNGTAPGECWRSIGRECILARVDCVDGNGELVPVGEIGEMVLSAPWLFSGYWNMPERTSEVLREGRYYTGDLARKDEHGLIYLEGRMKDMIKSGGLNVYPAEIEMVLKEHANVLEVAVVGVADAEWGEKVVACIIAEGNTDKDSLIAYCKTELASYKIPKSIVFMEDFPRDVVGKILKRELRELVADG